MGGLTYFPFICFEGNMPINYIHDRCGFYGKPVLNFEGVKPRTQMLCSKKLYSYLTNNNIITAQSFLYIKKFLTIK